jgi:hypothetical protein
MVLQLEGLPSIYVVEWRYKYAVGIMTSCGLEEMQQEAVMTDICLEVLGKEIPDLRYLLILEPSETASDSLNSKANFFVKGLL